MALVVTGVVFCAGALGLLAYKVDYSTTSFFKHSVESVSGFDVLRQAFPAGTLAPTTVLVESDNGPVTQADIADGRAEAAGPSTAWRGRSGDLQRSRDGAIATLDLDPARAIRPTSPRSTSCPRMRDAVADLVARRHRPRRRQQRDQLRHRQGESARPGADRAARAAGDGGDPGDPAAGARGAARAARERGPLVRLHPRASRSCSSGSSSATPASTPRSRSSPSSSWSRSGSTTRSS